MNVGILLITHTGLGNAILHIAQQRFYNLPLPCHVFELDPHTDIATALPLASQALRQVDKGNGVLLMTDLQGGRPSALAAEVARLGTPCQCVAGLNASMLLRVLEYPELALSELTTVAASAARNGVQVNA